MRAVTDVACLLSETPQVPCVLCMRDAAALGVLRPRWWDEEAAGRRVVWWVTMNEGKRNDGLGNVCAH